MEIVIKDIFKFVVSRKIEIKINIKISINTVEIEKIAAENYSTSDVIFFISSDTLDLK